MDISLDLVVEAGRRRLATLTPEVVGYMVLLAAHRLEPRPSRVLTGSVLLTEGGEVEILPAPAADELEVESALRALLALLLELSPSPAPAIAAVAAAPSSGSVQALGAELAAALIPINHAAAHRALARLYRETMRAQGRVIGTTAPPAPRAAPAVPAPPIPDLAEASAPGDANTGPELWEIELALEGLDIEPSPAASETVARANETWLESNQTPAPLDEPRLEPTAACIAENAATARANDAIDDLTSLPPPVELIRRAIAIDIDIDVDLEPELAGKPIVSEQRSDLRDLLQRYLAHTRSEERMTRTLRTLIDLEHCKAASSAGSARGLGPTVPG